MRNFTKLVEQREEGVRLLEEAGKLYKLASESENMTELLDLTLRALNRDLEALSVMWEATISQSQMMEEVKNEWEAEISDLNS